MFILLQNARFARLKRETKLNGKRDNLLIGDIAFRIFANPQIG